MAKAKLNGWQRLWILASGLWLVPVVFITGSSFPTTVPRDKIITALSRESQSKMVLTLDELAEAKSFIKPVPQEDLPEDLRGGQGVEKLPPGVIPSYELELPDGNLLEFDFRPTTTEAAATVVFEEIRRVYKKQLRTARIETITNAFLYWSIPCSVLYALGWAIAWVRRGFHAA